MRFDDVMAALELELCEEYEVPKPDAYKYAGASKRKSPPKWQKAYDTVDKFIESDMDIASVKMPDENKVYSANFVYRLANAIQLYARKQGLVAKKRGDKVYLIKDKEN